MGHSRVPRGTSSPAVLIAVAVATMVLADVLHARAARRGHGANAPFATAGKGYVVLLGFANRRSEINVINRWRARIAVRCTRGRPSATIICCGGAVHGPVAEAELLRRYLKADLGWSGQIVTEAESHSTWENVRNAAPMLVDAKWITFASNSLHAEKARAYLRRQHPELAARLIPGRDHRWGEMAAVKPIFGAVGLWKLIRNRRFHVEHRDQ